MILTPLVAAALAAVDPRAPLAAELHVPTEGPVRVDLPAAWVARCPDPTTYRLVDAAGREVPYATRTSDEAPPEREGLTWEPLERTPWSWTYLVRPPAGGAPTTALSIRGVPEGRVVEVTVRRPGDGGAVAKGLVWNLPDTGAGVRSELPLPASARRGPWRVDLHVVNLWRARPWVEFEAVTEGVERVEPASWSVDVEPPSPLGPADSRLRVPLPRADLPVRGLRVIASDPLFSRPAVVRDGRGAPLASGHLERFALGEAPIDVDRVALRATVSHELLVDLTDDRSVPLEVSAVELELRGLALLAAGGAPGRWTLSGCGPAGARYDVERLSDRLFDEATPRVSPGPPLANPGWTAALVTEGLAAPGPPLSRPSAPAGVLEGGPGLVALRLPLALEAAGRPDRADLRFVDASGRQLPWLWAEAAPARVPITTEVVEEGATTRLRIGLPHEGLPLEQLALYAERSRFERAVRIEGAGAPLALRWSGDGEGTSRLVVPLGRRAGRTVEVRIENGDNAPLPLLEPTLTASGTEVRLVAPEGEVEVRRLLSEVSPPRYDLALLRSELFDGPALPATVAPSAPAPAPAAFVPAPAPVVPAPAAPARDARLVTAAVGALSLVLGLLALRLRHEGS